MKLFVCLWALFAVASAGFLGLGGGGGGHVKGPHFNHGVGGPAKLFRVQVINEGRSGSYGPGPGVGQASAPQTIRLIHQQSSGFSGNFGGNAPTKVIKVIHQQAESTAASSLRATLGPVSAPAQVIKVIHEHGTGYGGSFAASGSAIQQKFTAPAKVIRVIHEVAPAQSAIPAASFPSPAVTYPDNNYLPPVQTPAQSFIPPAQQYGAPSYQNIAASTQYLPPPQPQYSEPPAFTAPEPVPAPSHVPADSYGPPSQ